MTDTNNNRDAAREVFWRNAETLQRGHREYQNKAKRNDEYYRGGGLQWDQGVKAQIEGEGRPAVEVNLVQPAVNDIAGLQITSRIDVSFLPRGGRGDEKTAKLLSQTMKYSQDQAKYRWHESQAFLDGLIMQRGYLDIRMGYDKNSLGDVVCSTPDPNDVIPDPDAKDYDPDTWGDVQIQRWLTLREIEGTYGEAAAKAVEGKSYGFCNMDFSESGVEDRGGFGMPWNYAMTYGWYDDPAKQRRYRVIDRQSNEYVKSLTALWPTGDMHVVEGLPREHLAWLIDHGAQIIKRRMRRVRWQVAAPEVCFVNKLSPYDHFTIVPFFPMFRRGKTVCPVDNMTSPQDMLNKFMSQFAHAVNSSANGGWQGEANSLSNMDDATFISKASETGLILLRKAGKPALEKIKANDVPSGLDRMIDYSTDHLAKVSGTDPNARGIDRSDMSGIALQALDYSQQRKLALPLDNLSRTRHLVADRFLECIQKFMGNERIIRITEVNDYGAERQTMVGVNVITEGGEVLNDLTIGEYDAVVNERPTSVTFNNSEFEQIKAMRKDMEIPIPDATVIRASNLADKSDIADAMEKAAGQSTPSEEADIALKTAQANLAKANATAKSVEAQYSAIQTATAIVVTPAAAALADALLRSAGYVDQDASPIVPEVPAGMEAPIDPGIPQNTHPLDPANPEVGMTTGLSDGPLQP